MTGNGGKPSAPDILMDALLAARVSRLRRSSGAATTGYPSASSGVTTEVVVVVETTDVVVEEEILEVSAPRFALSKEDCKSKKRTKNLPTSASK